MMARPLYKGSDGAHPNGNFGLWYDKFCNTWKEDFQGIIEEDRKSGNREGKKAWVDSLAGKKAGDKDQLALAVKRLQKMINANGGYVLSMSTTCPFVSGLGREHPIGNGFVWHHTMGTPYLPGTSFKGIIRAWASQWKQVDPGAIQRIFGQEGKAADENPCQGSVIFLDAIPSGPVKLKAEVMTPHYGPWYQDPQEVPADWHNTNPIPFLAVDQEQLFLFGVLPSPRSGEEAIQDCQTVLTWLPEALEWIGAGAKTAAGYGRFIVNPESARAVRTKMRKDEEKAMREALEREVEKTTAGLSPLATELFKAASVGNWEKDKEAFSSPGVIEGWLERLEIEPDPAAVTKLHGIMLRHFAEVLKDPDKVQGKPGKEKPSHKPRQIAFAKRMLALTKKME